MINTYPLQWPVGYKRTEKRIDSKFKQDPIKAQLFLRNEIKLLGAINLIVSSNCVTRNDGLIYADMSKASIKDPGVAIYFKWKSKDVVMCADKYLTPIENLIALAKGIEALRGMDRWGVSEFMDRAFTGFQALPEQASKQEWWQILGIPQNTCSIEEASTAYRAKAKQYHPDVPGGDHNKFIELQNAYEKALNTIK